MITGKRLTNNGLCLASFNNDRRQRLLLITVTIFSRVSSLKVFIFLKFEFKYLVKHREAFVLLFIALLFFSA